MRAWIPTAFTAAAFHAWRILNTSRIKGIKGILPEILVFRKEMSKNLRGASGASLRLMACGVVNASAPKQYLGTPGALRSLDALLAMTALNR
jgi:hypothetical protein